MFTFKRNQQQHKRKKTFSEELFEAIFIILPIAFIIRTFGYGLYQVPTSSMETTMLVGERFFADKFTVLFREIKRGDIISFVDPNYQYSNNKFMELFQRYVWGPSNWTKRVIGVPGDEVKGTLEDGKPVVYLKKKGESEFKKLDEPYLNKYPLIALCDSRKSLDYKSYDPNFSFQDQPFYRLSQAAVTCAQKLAPLYNQPIMKQPQTPTTDQNGKIVDEFNIKLQDKQYWAMGDNRLYSYDSRMWGPLDKKYIHGKIVFRIWSSDSFESWWIVDLIKHPIDFWKRVRWSRCLQTVK